MSAPEQRRVGETFMADGARWTVYEIRPDGTVCSRCAGSKPGPNALDYTKGCAYSERRRDETRSCSEYVVAGTRYCRKHQYVQRYYVDGQDERLIR